MCLILQSVLLQPAYELNLPHCSPAYDDDLLFERLLLELFDDDVELLDDDDDDDDDCGALSRVIVFSIAMSGSDMSLLFS